MKKLILLMVGVFLTSMAALATADEYNVPVTNTVCAVAQYVEHLVHGSTDKFSSCTIWPHSNSITVYFGDSATAAAHKIASGQSLTFNAYDSDLETNGITILSNYASEEVSFISTKIRTMD